MFDIGIIGKKFCYDGIVGKKFCYDGIVTADLNV